MFIGHFAVGFAAKRAAPRTSLTTLVAAAIFLDVLWPIFLWLGIEQARIAPGHTAVNQIDFVSYPYSHSLLMALAWSAALALLYAARTRYVRGAVVVGLAVSSHWLLDFVAHGPDLPLAPGLPARVGLGLWNSMAATVAVEGTLFVAGVALYLGATRAKSWAGHVSLWSIVGLLALAYVGNLVGPAAPSVEALRSASTAVLALLLWFVWVDRTRAPRVPPASASRLS